MDRGKNRARARSWARALWRRWQDCPQVGRLEGPVGQFFASSSAFTVLGRL